MYVCTVDVHSVLMNVVFIKPLYSVHETHQGNWYNCFFFKYNFLEKYECSSLINIRPLCIQIDVAFSILHLLPMGCVGDVMSWFGKHCLRITQVHENSIT